MTKRNLFIDFIKFPMAFLVMYAHVPGRPELHLDSDVCWLTVLSIVCYIPHYLSGIAMRSFFVISGYLFYKNISKWDFKLFWDKLKKRYRILVPSYLLWITLFVIQICVIYHKNPFDYFSEKGLMNVYLGFDNINTMMTKCYPLLYPMWYVRDLLVAFTISPLLYWVLKMSPWGFWGIFLLDVVDEGITNCIPTSAFFFVSVGIFVALYGQGIKSFMSFPYMKLLVVVIAVTVFACNLLGYNWTSMGAADYFRSLITMLVFYLMTRNLNFSKFAKFGRCSYFVFAFHPFLIELFLKVHYTRLSLMNVDLTIPYAFLYLIFPVLIYCIGYYVDKAIKSCSPFLSRLLCAS